jgi:hypothetical protein
LSACLAVQREVPLEAVLFIFFVPRVVFCVWVAWGTAVGKGAWKAGVHVGLGEGTGLEETAEKKRVEPRY